MFLASVILLALAAFLALGNLVGCFAAVRRQRRGIDEGYSNIAGVSAILCLVAWLLDTGKIGLWAFLPAVVDPGTWSVLVLPFFLLHRRLSDDRNGADDA